VETGVGHQLNLSNSLGIFLLAALAVGTGLWAAQVSVSSSTRGAEWALGALPRSFRWSLVLGTLGVALALIASPAWVGLGVVYLAAVVGWTARAVLRGLQRMREAGSYEPLPIERQAALVGRVGLWLLVIGALGVGVAAIDIERRGGVALWDFVLVGVVVAAGVLYRRRAGELDSDTVG